MHFIRQLLLITLLVSLLCKTNPAQAQKTDFQSWTLVTATANLDEEHKWFAYLEAQPRIGNDVSKLERLLVRPAIGYNIDKNLSLYLGYGWTPTFMNPAYDDDFRNENRIWQQVLYKHDLCGIQWQHRLRQEQRLIDGASGTSNRTRYLVRGSYDLASDGSYGLTGYNEIFVTANGINKGPEGGFDRDRFFFGPLFRAGPGRYEIGYLGEYARQFGNDSRMINALLMSAQFSF